MGRRRERWAEWKAQGRAQVHAMLLLDRFGSDERLDAIAASLATLHLDEALKRLSRATSPSDLIG